MTLDFEEFSKELEDLPKEDTFTLVDHASVFLGQVQSFVEYSGDHKMAGANAYPDMEETAKGLLSHENLATISVYHDALREKVLIGEIYFNSEEGCWDKIYAKNKHSQYNTKLNKLTRLLNAFDENIDNFYQCDEG